MRQLLGTRNLEYRYTPKALLENDKPVEIGKRGRLLEGVALECCYDCKNDANNSDCVQSSMQDLPLRPALIQVLNIGL